jgi:hypothetical protein
MRSPRPAVQHQEWHRHWRTDQNGTVEHAHWIGRREHEHLSQRLSRVVLSWAERNPAPHIRYADDSPWMEIGVFTFAVLMFACWLIAH